MGKEVKLDSYSNVLTILNHSLQKVDFQQTLQLVNYIDNKLNNSSIQNIEFMKTQLSESLFSDFLINVNNDKSSYNLIMDEYKRLISDINKKRRPKRDVKIMSFKEKIMDQNVGYITSLYENQSIKDLQIRDLRFYLLLFGLVLFSDTAEDIIDEYLQFFNRYNSKNRSDRFNLIQKYLTYKQQFENEKGNKISELKYLRNQIAHCYFTTNGKEIVIFNEGNEDIKLEFSYEEIFEIYQQAIIKTEFIKIIIQLEFFIPFIEKK